MKTCPACESKEQKYFGSKNGFELLRCDSCQTLYSEINQLDSFDYATYYETENVDIPGFVKNRLAEIVNTFDNFRKGNSLLDIGCGAGYLLEAAKKQNWQVLGIEISDSAVNNLRARGINVFQGSLSELDAKQNSFDVIVSTEVIEHISEPLELAESAYKLLRKGGLFWGTTPNGKGISSGLLGEKWSIVAPPEHIQLFSRSGLRKMLERAGFNKIEIATHGVNPLELYHSLLKRSDTAKKETVDLQAFDRVNTSYQINENLSQGLAKTFIKSPVNRILNLLGLGDSLKFWAIK